MMQERNELRERYEDALFAMMMDELASAEGERALEENERLREDPNAAVPERTDRRCMRTIRSHFRRVKARAAGRFALRAVGRAATVFGVISALFVGAFAASETVRNGTMNLVIETFGVSTDFYFTAQPKETSPQLVFGWMPEGFVLDCEEPGEAGTTYIYSNQQGQYICAMYVQGEGQVVSIDTENAEVSSVQIQGVEAMVVCKDGTIQIAWGSKEKTGFISLHSDGVSREELIRVAEELDY